MCGGYDAQGMGCGPYYYEQCGLGWGDGRMPGAIGVRSKSARSSMLVRRGHGQESQGGQGSDLRIETREVR